MLGIGIGVPFSVQSLIAQIQAIFVGKTGFWGRPILLSSLFQDSAGATPVTAVEQPVGRMVDQSGSGNTVVQPTAAARPVLSARVNLLTKTDDTSDSVWVRGGTGTITPVAGTPTVYGSITRTGDSTAEGARQQVFSTVSGVTYQLQLRMAEGSASSGFFGCYDGVSFKTWSINLSTGAIAVIGGSATATPTATAVSDGWLIGIVLTSGTTAANANFGAGLPPSVTGSVQVRNFHINTGTTATRYQRVNTATDYDTVGFPSYLRFDGVDDSLSSATGGGGTAGFFFCAAVQISGGAGTNRLLISDRGPAAGYICQIDSGNSFSLGAGNGSTFVFATTPAPTIGVAALLTAWDNGVTLNLQINSESVVSIARPVVTAGSAGFSLGKSNISTVGYFNGNIYTQVYVRNSGLTASERANIQAHVRQQAGL